MEGGGGGASRGGTAQESVVVKQKVQGTARIDREQEKQVGKASVVDGTVKGSRICNRRSDDKEEKGLWLSITDVPVNQLPQAMLENLLPLFQDVGTSEKRFNIHIRSFVLVQ